MKYTKCSLPLLLILSLVFAACSKEQRPDAADAFVGVYSVSVTEHVIWGYDSGTITDTGTMSISKESATRVKIDGYISTYGEISGNILYMEGGKSSSAEGYLTTTYSPATLTGNVLTFTANQSGQLASNGTLYPFRSSGSFSAIKQY